MLLTLGSSRSHPPNLSLVVGCLSVSYCLIRDSHSHCTERAWILAVHFPVAGEICLMLLHGKRSVLVGADTVVLDDALLSIFIV